MTAESYIRAIPKVELNLQLEGAIARETLLMLAEQNEMEEQIKKFNKWVAQYREPDFNKLDDLTAMLRSWLQYGDDLTRAVYDVGVRLSKENVQYAEVGINPLSFVTGDFTFDEFLEALNDGRDRVERGWGVQMRWVMLIPRAEPRYADEIARWATSNMARDGGVVALGLVGYKPPKAATLDQFERAFSTAERKGLACVAYLNETDDVDEAVDLLGLDTVVDAWGLGDSPETASSLQSRGVAVNIGVERALKRGWITEIADYPLANLLDNDVPVIVNSDMPVLYGATLTEEYLKLFDAGLMTLKQIEANTQAALTHCHLPGEDAAVMSTIFQTELDVLREEHLAEIEETAGEED